MSLSCTVGVTHQKCAVAMCSGDLQVYATPSMIALMEQAAAECVLAELGEGMTSVGIYIVVSHSKATAMGDVVTATATLTEVNGRELSFDIVAQDTKGVIGNGTHKRFIVDRAKFMAKLQ